MRPSTKTYQRQNNKKKKTQGISYFGIESSWRNSLNLSIQMFQSATIATTTKSVTRLVCTVAVIQPKRRDRRWVEPQWIHAKPTENENIRPVSLANFFFWLAERTRSKKNHPKRSGPWATDNRTTSNPINPVLKITTKSKNYQNKTGIHIRWSKRRTAGWGSKW